MKEIRDWNKLAVRELEMEEITGHIDASARSYTCELPASGTLLGISMLFGTPCYFM